MRPHQIGALVFFLIVVSFLLSSMTRSSGDEPSTVVPTEQGDASD